MSLITVAQGFYSIAESISAVAASARSASSGVAEYNTARERESGGTTSSSMGLMGGPGDGNSSGGVGASHGNAPVTTKGMAAAVSTARRSL